MATSLKACATLQPTDLRYVVCELDIRSWEATSMLLWTIAGTPAMPPIYSMVTDAAEMPQCPSTFQHDACCHPSWLEHSLQERLAAVVAMALFRRIGGSRAG